MRGSPIRWQSLKLSCSIERDVYPCAALGIRDGPDQRPRCPRLRFGAPVDVGRDTHGATVLRVGFHGPRRRKPCIELFAREQGHGSPAPRGHRPCRVVCRAARARPDSNHRAVARAGRDRFRGRDPLRAPPRRCRGGGAVPCRSHRPARSCCGRRRSARHRSAPSGQRGRAAGTTVSGAHGAARARRRARTSRLAGCGKRPICVVGALGPPCAVGGIRLSQASASASHLGPFRQPARAPTEDKPTTTSASSARARSALASSAARHDQIMSGHREEHWPCGFIGAAFR